MDHYVKTRLLGRLRRDGSRRCDSHQETCPRRRPSASAPSRPSLVTADALVASVEAAGYHASLPVGDDATPSTEDDPAAPWTVIGRVVEAGPHGPRLTVGGAVPSVTGWDHFAG